MALSAQTQQIRIPEYDEAFLYNLQAVKALKRYHLTQTHRSLWQVATTFIPFFALWYLAYYSLNFSYALTLAITLLNAGFAARIFIIQHDCGHGSFLKSRRTQNLLGCFCSLFTLIPYHYWRKVHAIHHATLGNLDQRSPGELPLMTVKEYLNASPQAQQKYRFFRHPLTILGLIPPILFYLDFRTPRNSSEFSKKEQYTVYLTDLALLAGVTGLMTLIGWKAFLLVHLPLSLLLSTIAMWMFYIQHQFEDTYWTSADQLDFVEASLKGSSYLKLPKLFHWFTGNVGYHHIHHLSPMIPNYHLARCHNENPQFHGVTALTFFASFKTLNLALWDEDSQKLISFKTLAQRF